MDVQPTHTFKNCPSVGISPRLFPLYPCYTLSLILISHLISLSQDGIIAFLLWGSAEQLPFTTSPEFKTFWDETTKISVCLSTVDRRSRERFIESSSQIASLVEKFKLEGAAYRKLSASAANGEVENAERMFAKAQAEVQSRASTEDKFTLVGWAPR